MAIGSTIPFTAIPWDDVLFVLLAGTMLASGLAVVVMKDIIRCGLAMMVCFGALAGIYVMAGAPLVGAAQVLVYIGAISVLILFAIMLTQTKSAPTRLAFQTQAVPAAVAAVILLLVVLLAVGSTTWGGGTERGDDEHRRRREDPLRAVRPAVRDRRRAPARGRDRRRLPRQARPSQHGRSRHPPDPPE